MAHTPGPWYVNGSELIGDSTILATLCWHSGRDAENKADEHLIAAAPELLASLKEVREWMSNWHPNFFHDDEWPAAEARMDAAIAKATGE